jgi:S-adenosylmethionine:tRNA ribosyltransferase-isomerase
MRTEIFDFPLPAGLIAQMPVPERDSCRLMVLEKSGKISHRIFKDITDFFSSGDMIVLNNTKVFPARLSGRKESGGFLDILLVKERGNNEWEVLSRGNYTGYLSFSDTLRAFVRDGKRALFSATGSMNDELWAMGKMPLPPYIRRKANEYDREWYQTVYADKEGSIAAPTAGLHFSHTLLDRIAGTGVSVRFITLHVGIGTFRTIKTELTEHHRMEKEYFEIDAPLIEEIGKAKSSGRRVIAVGTTTTRALEGYFNDHAEIMSNNGSVTGYTDIFITPGYDFKVVDCLVTNLHLPKSTPLLLTSALAGTELILSGYAEAIKQRYRFFSYGDAMLIL